MRLFILAILGIGIAACSKNNDSEESQLYGTWVKGTNAGDTLWFMKKDGKNIMRSNQSFNASLPNYKEEEYTLRNGTLARVLPVYSSAQGSIPSFTWRELRKNLSYWATSCIHLCLLQKQSLRSQKFNRIVIGEFFMEKMCRKKNQSNQKQPDFDLVP